MQSHDADAVAAALGWPELIDAIERLIVDPAVVVPDRAAHTVERPGGADATLLLKPGWRVGDALVVKVVTFYPDNGALDLPTVNAGVLLFDANNGTLIGACDGNELTTRRTAAASAVASKRLARANASHLLVVGTGAVAPMTALAHAEVRELARITLWGRRPDRAAAVAEQLTTQLPDVRIDVSDDLDTAVPDADIISCVTSTTTPLVKGALLSPGTHVDLIGSFSAAMRETDDEVIRRGTVWVDTYVEAMAAGDIRQPLDTGLLDEGDIQGDLGALVAGPPSARHDDAQITVFKSAGTAVEDLAATQLLFGR